MEPSYRSDPLSEAFAKGIRWLQRHAVPFLDLQSLWVGRGHRKETFAYAYIFTSAVLETVLLAGLGLWRNTLWVVIVCAIGFTYRYLDVVLVYVEMLFCPQEPARFGMERNLLLLVLNLMELSLVGAGFLALTTNASIGGAWFAAFGTLSLYDLPSGGSVMHHVAGVALAVAALLLVAGGLGLILAGVGRKFDRRV